MNAAGTIEASRLASQRAVDVDPRCIPDDRLPSARKPGVIGEAAADRLRRGHPTASPGATANLTTQLQSR
jgi:hypothetical protein